jgi:Domain of unknown function (DUF5668)/B-box zinc finger
LEEAIMNCAVHTDVPATGYCRQCGKPLCPGCTHEVRGALFCEDCLATRLSLPQAGESLAPAQPDLHPQNQPAPTGSPAHAGTALALGFIPGLGAVYNGEYIKALIHVVIFGGIIALLSTDLPDSYDAFLGIALACFYCYMPIDAYRVAKARRLGEPQPPDLMQSEGRKPIGAMILIGLGIIFLLANFGLLQKEWFSKSWPVALVALGIWILMDRMRKNG